LATQNSWSHLDVEPADVLHSPDGVPAQSYFGFFPEKPLDLNRIMALRDGIDISSMISIRYRT
jgi:hypothetical protein